MPPFDACLLLVQFFLFFFVVKQVAVFGDFHFSSSSSVVIFLLVVGNDVQVNGMRLRNFQLRFALWATQDLAFFHFIFIDINFGGTLRAANHGSILHRFVGPAATRSPLTAVKRIIYFTARSQTCW